MVLTKQRDFFDPSKVNGDVHIIGCGSVGSSVAEQLARCGLSRLDLWDDDIVEDKNIQNQMFTTEDVGMLKVDALERIVHRINPECVVRKHARWNGDNVSGYVFLAVDSIDVRRSFVDSMSYVPFIKGVFDIRTGLTNAQAFAADWTDRTDIATLLSTMNFSQEEALAETPVSACGETLGVVTTVRAITAVAVSNFINFVKGDRFLKIIQMDAFSLTVSSV